jgi:hypothetical protein
MSPLTSTRVARRATVRGMSAGSGFDPSFDLGHLSRQQLADLGREYMMFAFLLTRSGLGWVHLNLGEHEREQVAILEWMGASPVYTQRMQRALNFVGTGMDTIFKGLQLDVGFAHQYMDVGYNLIDANNGEFWLKSCGALLDVEPMGEDFVVSMCHHIEDPTFDATAVATNPRARIRPIHRPPRHPVGRDPHCHWTATIDPNVDPIIEHELTRRVRTSKLADVPTAVPATSEAGGWADYSGEFDPEFQLEALGHRALVQVATELALQSHFLVRAMLLAVTDRHGADSARRLAVEMWIGSNWVGSERLRKALGLPDGLEGVLRTLQVHPAFPPDYAPLDVEVLDDTRARVSLTSGCAALSERDDASWFALLADGNASPLDALVKGVDPHASIAAAGDDAWDIVVDPASAPIVEPEAVAITRVGSVAGFKFERRRRIAVTSA